MIDQARDILLFFTPEAGVLPHYVAQCVLGKTMQELGYQVVFARCVQDFVRCPVMDMYSLPFDRTSELKTKVCRECMSISAQLLRHYGLRSLELKPSITDAILDRVGACVQQAPADLREFTFEDIALGKIVAHDLVFATKCSDFSTPGATNRTAWLQYIEGALLNLLTLEEICRRLPVKRIVFHNDYNLNLAGRLAAQRLGIGALTVSHAGHLNIDRRLYIIVPELVLRTVVGEHDRWPEWRSLSLSAEQIKSVGDDIIYRFGAQGSHIYSPAKTTQQANLFEMLGLLRERKLLVAYTSSLDEIVAHQMMFDGLGLEQRHVEQPFADQIEWLSALTEYVRKSDHLQLVVRVHPREGVNKREKNTSQHLVRLVEHFDRAIPHCRFIWPEESVSSYDLMEVADLALTAWSTISLEAARLGVPSLVAFGWLTYPDDDFMVWVPTQTEYFERLEALLQEPASLERLVRAFRCHHAFRLGLALDLGDVIPQSDFGGIPVFKLPKEARAIEEIIVALRNPYDINRQRLTAAQSPERGTAEALELKRQLARIVHFLHVGSDETPALPLWNQRPPVNRSSVPRGQIQSARWVECHGNRTRYFDGEKEHERYSPASARLAALCVEPPPSPAAAAVLDSEPMRESGKNTGAARLGLPLRAKGRIVFLNTYYPKFIESHYRSNPALESALYEEQLRTLINARFGDSDFYSHPFVGMDWDAQDLIVNCASLQKAWARENGVSGVGLEIAAEQIRRARPQIVYLQDLNLATAGFLSAIRPHAELVVGQIASQLPAQADLSKLDVIFTSFPHFVDRFRSRGTTAYYLPLAFDSRVLAKLPNLPRTIPVTFIGGLSAAHGKGFQLLSEIARSVPIDVWGYGLESLPEDSPMRARHHGEVWGLPMFSLFQQSRITLNRHIDVAENYANNMRLFEATGCGCLLLTDYKDNLNELFEIGKEVVAFRSPGECAALIKYFLANPEEGNAIARAGQERTLRDHTYAKRMEKVAEILKRHLRHKRERLSGHHFDYSKISYGHAPITSSQVNEALTSAWKSEDIPARQRALVQQELAAMYRGKPPLVFQVLAEALRPVIKSGASVLEIGCASGYYFEVLDYLLRKEIAYTGVDYSPAMISLAENQYPKASFRVADGADLPFPDEQFDTAISSCILLHVPNYSEHIAETARVARRFVIAHRTPVCRQRPTQYLTKFAYGVKTVELRFNEQEFLSEFLKNGLELVHRHQYSGQSEADEFDLTYVFSKRRKARSSQGNMIDINRERVDSKPRTLAAMSSAESGAQPSPAQQEELRQTLLTLFTDAGVNAVKACLDGMQTHERMTAASWKLVEEYMHSPSGMEALQLKLQFAKSRAEGNFRFYLQPQLEKFFLWLLESNEITNYTYDIDPLNKEYLASTVALVTHQPVRQIECYIEEIGGDNQLREHIQRWILRSPQRHVCDLNVQYGRRIGWYALVRALKPKVVIETGVEKGMGTCVIARALMKNTEEGYSGAAYATDIDPNAGFLVKGLYEQFAHILYGDSIESLRKFSQRIDLFINDSAHSSEYERQEYATIQDKLNERAIILSDDAHGSNELRRFALATGRHFLFFPERPQSHWYPGAGIGIAFKHD